MVGYRDVRRFLGCWGERQKKSPVMAPMLTKSSHSRCWTPKWCSLLSMTCFCYYYLPCIVNYFTVIIIIIAGWYSKALSRVLRTTSKFWYTKLWQRYNITTSCIFYRFFSNNAARKHLEIIQKIIKKKLSVIFGRLSQVRLSYIFLANVRLPLSWIPLSCTCDIPLGPRWQPCSSESYVHIYSFHAHTERVLWMITATCAPLSIDHLCFVVIPVVSSCRRNYRRDCSIHSIRSLWSIEHVYSLWHWSLSLR